ncbi:PAS domain-containing protein [Halorientalis salina]|uniref:PAS domain-containing protein n=1 Tax=Halorientalis salina TaxID=2932266 RepID=UPI0010AC8FF8|nr:PAS domain-containing protein [Halorientalis salina]
MSSVESLVESPGESVLRPSTIRVLRIDEASDDEAARRLTFEDEDGIEWQSTTGSVEGAELDRIDCVVSTDDTSVSAKLDSLATVREHDPTVPFVLVTGEGSDDVAGLRSDRWTESIPAPPASTITERLKTRIRQLVAHRRAVTVAERALGTVETVRDGVCIAGPGGTIEFANNAFVSRFGTDRSELVGSSWRSLYTESAVDRLERTALPTVRDGWRWSGECTGRRVDGEPFTANTSVVALDDGSLVFTIHGIERSSTD